MFKRVGLRASLSLPPVPVVGISETILAQDQAFTTTLSVGCSTTSLTAAIILPKPYLVIYRGLVIPVLGINMKINRDFFGFELKG